MASWCPSSLLSDAALLTLLTPAFCVQSEVFDLEWSSIEAGSTPLHVAAQRNDERMCRILLQAHLENRGNIVPSYTPGKQPRGVGTRRQRLGQY